MKDGDVISDKRLKCDMKMKNDSDSYDESELVTCSVVQVWYQSYELMVTTKNLKVCPSR